MACKVITANERNKSKRFMVCSKWTVACARGREIADTWQLDISSEVPGLMKFVKWDMRMIGDTYEKTSCDY